MDSLMLTLYVLIWPVVVGGVLYTLVHAFMREVHQARSEGRPLI
ncbi:putative transporter small subunit [Falsochrobactrum ovis]|nr:putative transporter small subunit [Falsochrobactrum ovis]